MSRPPDLQPWLQLSLLSERLPASLLAELRTREAVCAFLDRPEKYLPEARCSELQAHLQQYAASVDAALNWQGTDRLLLGIDDPRYPPLLRELADAPPLLYVMGDVQLLQAPQLAIVGSRTPTVQGKDHAQAFAETLARAGLVITSGMAQGIDAAAHRGALQSGQTIAVVGTGIDRVYPAAHRELAHAIAANGCVISEFPLGMVAMKHHFPRRNRIIAGMSLGTLVVEAALSSGSLITARQALDYGREVFAIPGSVHNPLARGCHALIRQGAKLVETAADVLDELRPWLQEMIADMPASAGAGPSLIGAAAPLASMQFDAEQQCLLAALGEDICTPDTLVERSGLDAGVVAGMLLTLELNDVVAAVPGGYQRRHR